MSGKHCHQTRKYIDEKGKKKLLGKSNVCIWCLNLNVYIVYIDCADEQCNLLELFLYIYVFVIWVGAGTCVWVGQTQCKM